MSFEENGYQVVKQAVNLEILELLAIEFQLLKDIEYYYKAKKPEDYQGDQQTPISFSKYGALCFESLMLLLKNKIEHFTGKRLLPTYSYARIYYQGATLPRHRDRPSCQYSVTICIQKDKTSWPIYIENYQGKEHCIDLEPGDMLIYHGDQLTHWREEYKEQKHIQAFLHYVDAHGQYKDYLYDKRPLLGVSPDTVFY